MSIVLTITDAGRAALVNAARDGTNAVRLASVGVSSTAISASPAATTLPGEVKRIATISGGTSAADVIHLIVRDESADSYTVRSFALYLANGTLFAIYGQAAPIIEKSGAALLLLAIDATLVDVSAAQITFGNANFLNPGATTETAGVVELATEAEAAALTDGLRALTPKGMAAIFTAANILSRLLQADGAGSGLDADLLDGRHASDFALIAGADFRGNITSSGRIYGGRGGGTAGLAGGGTDYSGFVEFLGPDGVRRSYVGFAAVNGPTMLLSENGGGWRFEGGPVTAADRITAGFGKGSVVLAGTTNGNTGFVEFVGLDGTRRSYVGFASASGPTILQSENGGGWRFDGGPLQHGTATVWTSGNDGAGSGLDADLLDGQDSSYYTNITARLGYTPLNAATFTGAEILSRLVAADGAGSGLDADLLDGRHASDFALLAGADFTGAITSSTRIYGGRGGGTAGLAGGGTDYSGFVEFIGADGTRRSYVGFASASGPTILQSENGGGWRFDGGPLQHGTATVWTSGNDGAGSGLDADLLDGQDSSYYTNITARLGYTPLNAATFTGAEILSRLIAVDGAGSGLDADLLDGQDGGYYTNITARLGYTPLNAATFTGAEILSRLIAVDGAGSGLDADLLDGQDGGYYTNITARLGYTPLNAATFTGAEILSRLVAADGAGSGLDADLLDGRHASDFALLAGADFTGAITSSARITAGRGGGTAALVGGGAGNTGFVEFIGADGTRRSYVGFADANGPTILLSENGGGWRFEGGPVTAPDRITAGFGKGSVVLAGTTNGNTGFVEFVGLDGTRRSFVGFASASGPTILQSENGGGWRFEGGPLQHGTATVWTSGNDGAGSGLDADLLDGQDSSYYTNITARLGYTPLNAATFTGAEILSRLVAADGAGSGLDADLLDGWHRDDIRRWGNLLDVPATFAPSAHSHAAADLAPAFASHSFTSDGYQVLPGGLILQWVTGSMSSQGTEPVQSLTFPITFPNACLQAIPGTQLDFASTAGDAFYQLAGAPTTTGVSVQRQYTGGGRDERPSAPRVFAIGY